MDFGTSSAFRRYYNTHIFPELQRMERLRRRLLFFLAASGLGITVLLVASLQLGYGVLVIFLLMPIVFFVIYLIYSVQQFRQTFKPRIVNLILEFMTSGQASYSTEDHPDNALNFAELSYHPKQTLPKELFLQSGIFLTKADYFIGEDLIKGFVGEMPFAMSELVVRELSPMTNKLQEVFEGVFLRAIFPETDTSGSIIVWPRKRKLYNTRAIQEYTYRGASNKDDEILLPGFREQFLVYATEDTHVAGILSEPMQQAIVRFCSRFNKDVYLAFRDRNIFVGISEEHDLLEPRIFLSNVHFELVRQYYTDIMMMLRIVQDFDQTH